MKISPEQVVLFLQTYCVGASNGMGSKDLVQALTQCVATEGEKRQLREVISALREEGFPILATPECGYFWAATADEINGICRWFHVRAVSSLRIISRLKRRALPKLEGQLTIPGIDLSPKIPEVAEVNYFREPQISVVAHIPEELHTISQQFLNERTDWDINRVYAAALSLFFLQEGIPAAAELYRRSALEEESEVS